MKQLTLRKIRPNVEKKLREFAETRELSINKTVLLLLNKALGITDYRKNKRDLSKIAGKWNKEEADEFEKNIEIFEQIDEEIWK